MVDRRYRIRSGASPVGTILIPGDKSVTHRAFLFGALAAGETVIVAPNRGADCLATAAALRRLGVSIIEKENRFVVDGRRGLLTEADEPLDMGNSGTGARLLAGLLAGQPFCSILDGDDSLRRRPMGRIVGPLRSMGARIDGREGGKLLPLTIHGGRLKGIRYETPVASAQIKSAVLLAGLGAEGKTEVIEPGRSRDHTERMIAYLGGAIERDGLAVSIEGGTELQGARIDVGGDPSSSAFFVVAALITPGGDVTVEGILDNPTRTAFLDVLEGMGGRIDRIPVETVGPEKRMNVRARESALTGGEIGGGIVPRLIDEIPVLAVAGACSSGTFRVRDAHELRVKESDRIDSVVKTLTAFGVDVEESDDGFVFEGGSPLAGARIDSGGDHRIAMSAAVAGLVARGETVVEGTGCVATSLPEFLTLGRSIGLGEAWREER